MKGKQQKKKRTKKNSKDIFPEAEFFGDAVVGTKGQFVIPKEARDEYDIQPGDKIIIFGGEGGVLAIMKADQLNEILENFTP
jgi:AbrB family looped-hinge helix DNA binding protein